MNSSSINALTVLFLLARISSYGAETNNHKIILDLNGLMRTDQSVKTVSSIVDHSAAQLEVQLEVTARTPPLYAGGDGSTLAQAVFIYAPDAIAGMNAERAWLEEKHPGHRPLSILPVKRGARLHHRVVIVTADGTTNKLFFEATGFYGRAPRTEPFSPPPKEYSVGSHRLKFLGGDGSSVEKAVLITGAPDQKAGIRSEYFWLAARMPDHRLTKQALLFNGGIYYDRIDVVGPGGNEYSFYFNISRFFQLE